ncbi:NAC domain-containing protein 62-like [Camellia sinensis]|uniref:NAC domain-containing protein 62-like n=1 Tax=Camellia sinensis TaxID=4442 RepID=UPI001035B865|nr:NAC domain-containing protein 62-like [Camellia sinensis]
MPVLPLNALPVGYRFSPTDAELINHFLSSKITGNQEVVTQIREVDLCKFEPWDLPAMSLIETNDDKWIFFCPKDSKYNNGKQSNRATRAGYWKATGKDRSIKSVNGTTVIGTMKTLAFYTGSAPKGQRTDWVIHEYSATSEGLGGSNPGQGSFLLFKLMKKHDKKLDRKQDDSTEGLICNEVDKNVSSSATIISFMP